MKSFLYIACFLFGTAQAQQAMPVTDSAAATFDGLQAGYTITGASEKEVGKKGNFSRYKIRFYVTNTANDARLILYRPNSTVFGSGASPKLAYFKCANATGARLTNKEVTLEAKPCYIDALVEEKECGSDKTVQNRRSANIGYWIKPGETIASNTIMIVPLNEQPSVTVTFFPERSSMPASVMYNDNNNVYSNNNQQQSQGFVRIKNYAADAYLHNQNGPLNCSGIDMGWWSAQWEMLPVSGTNYYVIRNRWKNLYISTDNGSMLSQNGQSANAYWTIDDAGTNNMYTIKNVATNAKLAYLEGAVKMINTFNNQVATQWIIEQ